MDKYDTSQITEFPRFEPESSQSGVSTFFTKLWKIPIFSSGDGADNEANKHSADGAGLSQQHDDQNKQEHDDKLETGTYAVEFEGRSLPNVLRRISSLVAMGSGGGTRYADTELARYWMPDDISRECYECAARFSTLRRRHHCRVCGQIFCSRCCSQRVPGHIFGCAGGLRVCNYCCNVVLSYLKENDMPGEVSHDLRTLQENLQVKFPDNKSSSSCSTDRFVFAREPEERAEARAPAQPLQDVFRHLAFTLPIQHHRYRLVRYNGVWRGGDILQWVMDNTSNKTRAQATLVCQNLLSAGYMECCTELPQFTDYALYKPIVLPPTNTEEETPEERDRLVESVSSYCLDLNLGENSARLTKTAKSDTQASPNEEEKPMIEQSEADTKQACKAILESGEDHLRLLMRQCLASEGLSAAWLDVLYPLCQQAAEAVVPDLYSSEIDVRNYVQVKKVPGGTMQDSCVVNGVVITKNVAHRGMPQQLSNPTVLLLDCSIAYQRVEGKLTSLEPVLLQEHEYLVRCAARISALRPRVVLVRGSAARAVQDALRHEGVALAVGVGERALRRAARCANADVVTSIDARIGLPRLGTCRNFYVKNFESKTLMVLENCAESHLGCSILLRGGSQNELVKLKKVAKFMLLACYNWKLEKSFLTDIEATLPEPGMSFVDDVNDDAKTENADENVDLSGDTKKSSINTEGKTTETNKKEDDKEIEDPLKRPKTFSRKAESDKNLSCGVPIQDFSDPLHLQSNLSVEDEVFLPKEQTVLKADSQNDRWSTDDVVLSMSPNVVINAPYLETEAGRKCALRKYFRRPLFPPRQPTAAATPKTRRKHSRVNDPGRVVNELHPFAKNPITAPCDDPKLKAALAHYRATGCRLVNNEHKATCPLYNPSVLKKPPKETDIEPPSEKEKESNLPLDPFSPESHQRLSLLFYSYSSKSANVPDFCVNPWIMSMEMYGARDIPLGAFLEKYCFNPDNKCPNQNCQVPMNQHVRKFVHGDVCITITCNTIGHSNVQLNDEQNKQVMFWSACTPCGASHRAARLTRASLSLSLATYLALRVSATRYLRAAACPHALHAAKHYFASRLTTACFKYNKITTWDIELPPDMISTKYDTKYMREMLINQLNELMLKGHEAFSAIADKEESEKEHQNFKQHMEQIHLALTSTSLQEQPTVHGVVRTLWSISDRIILGEKMLRDASDRWTSPAKPGKLQSDAASEDKLDAEDITGDSTSSDTTAVPDDTDKPVTEEDEEKGEKKTVRQIVSQLLSNNHNSNQVGMIISGGLIPVVVLAGEIGSVIAATLASITYQRTLHSLYNTQSDHEETESSGTSKDKAEGEKSKAKSNDHIEVVLKDGLLCRVYYAAQFHKLRHSLLSPLSSNRDIIDEFARPHPNDARPDPNVSEREKDSSCCYEDMREKTDNKNLCEIEEGFIRSLAHCVPWAARGGKSGSTFCKTKDDRYVLKEMTKPEWQQFLEFAPHYFNYVSTCRQNKLPSLLARILGVYSVGGAGVLVTENVFYARPALGKRFDLKGSSRHRLTPDTQPQAVLMDDNLLHLRWDTQFYLSSHQARVLWAGIERDTSFLAGKCVMDYSLLLGVDGNKLVLGIIDYIRTFTWDKKLEHLVKAHLGAGQPTVVSPDQYKLRFRQATNKYFLHCPERWDHLTHEPLP